MIPRSDKTRRVQQRIYADRPQCVAVVGDPRIGKTSFVRELLDSAAAGDPPPPSGTRFVDLALREPDLAAPETFLNAAVDRLERAFPGPAVDAAPAGDAASSRAYARFESAVQRVASSGGRWILFLDDFDRVTRSNAFPLPFFSFLRSNANNYPVAYVTTSRLDLQQLCALKEVEESPFFNIFQNVSLGPMDEAQMRKLAAERCGPSADGADWVAAQSGGLPALAAACCDVLASHVPPGTPAAEAALDEAAAPYLGELWDHLDAQHRTLLERLARGEAPGERDARPLRDLGPRRGYVRETDGRWAFVSPAFGRFVAARSGGPQGPGLITKVRRIFGGGGRP